MNRLLLSSVLPVAALLATAAMKAVTSTEEVQSGKFETHPKQGSEYDQHTDKWYDDLIIYAKPYCKLHPDHNPTAALKRAVGLVANQRNTRNLRKLIDSMEKSAVTFAMLAHLDAIAAGKFTEFKHAFNHVGKGTASAAGLFYSLVKQALDTAEQEVLAGR